MGITTGSTDFIPFATAKRLRISIIIFIYQIRGQTIIHTLKSLQAIYSICFYHSNLSFGRDTRRSVGYFYKTDMYTPEEASTN